MYVRTCIHNVHVAASINGSEKCTTSSTPQLPSLCTLTPKAAVCLPRLCLLPSTVTWWDSAKSWLLSQPAQLSSLLEPLLRLSLSLCLQFLSPVLQQEEEEEEGRRGGGGGDMGGSSNGSWKSSASQLSAAPSRLHLQQQCLRLTATHLVTTTCRIMEVRWPHKTSKITCLWMCMHVK